MWVKRWKSKLFDEIFRFYEIGKSIGLQKKEINNMLSRDSKYYRNICIFLLSVLIILLFVLISLASLVTYINGIDPTYPSNSYYSTVKIKDFSKKSVYNDKKYQILNYLLKILNYRGVS